MNDKEKKNFWRKLLGLPFGEEVTIVYEVPLNYNEKQIGSGEVFLTGKIVEIKGNTVVLESSRGVRVDLVEDQIKDVNPATEEEKEKLTLQWGGSLEQMAREIERKKNKRESK